MLPDLKKKKQLKLKIKSLSSNKIFIEPIQYSTHVQKVCYIK